jgi:repressor LexA
MTLTKRQKEVLDYLVAFETKHGYAPSFEEIGKGLKLTSLATVHKHITTLEKKDLSGADTIRAARSKLCNCRSR